MSFVTTTLSTFLRSAGRNRKLFVLRTLLATAALAMVATFLLTRMDKLQESDPAFFTQYLPVLGRSLFARLHIVMMLAVFIITPAYCAPIISMEREKQTLEMLISVPVGVFRILLSRLLSSIQVIFLIAMAVVPFMFILLMFGGVSPREILISIALILAWIFVCAGISLVVSAMSTSSSATQTIIYSYLMIVLYVFMVYPLSFLLRIVPIPLLWGILHFVMMAANPATVSMWFVSDLGGSVFAPGRGMPIYPYVICFAASLAVMFICMRIAASSVSRKETRLKRKLHVIRNSGLLLDGFRKKPDRYHYPVLPLREKENPVSWRDRNESMFGRRSGIISSVVITYAVFFMLCYLLPRVLEPDLWSPVRTGGSWLQTGYIYRFHSVCLGIEFTLALAYAILMCASTFSKERVRKTLETLLTSGMADHEIVNGKLKACARKAVFFSTIPLVHLCLALLHGVYTAAVVLLALFVMVALTYMLMNTGLLASALARRGTYAVIATVFVAAFLCFFPSVLSLYEAGPYYANYPHLLDLSPNPLRWIMNLSIWDSAAELDNRTRFFVIYGLACLISGLIINGILSLKLRAFLLKERLGAVLT